LAAPKVKGVMSAPSAAAAAGAAAAALLQKQLLQGGGGAGGDQAWSEHQTGDGRKFFHNEESGVSQWEKPDALLSESDRQNPTAWRQYRIWDGRTFYHNKETKVSCWSMPPELRTFRGESTGLDDRPLGETQAEKRNAFLDFLKAAGLDASWDWSKAQAVAKDAPEVEGISELIQKQCFTELLSLALKKQDIEARAKARNAAVALERLIEERFSQPEDLSASYEDAERLLGDEEAWQLMKSDVRRDEVFQTVMDRLEEKHQKARAEKRTQRVVRLQRLMSSDPELKRSRLRWKDALSVLARRDELQEEDPPLEALRVWTSLREMRLASEKEGDLKSKVQAEFFRDERKRRDDFVLAMKELAAAERLDVETTWAQVEEMLSSDQRFMCLRDGQGATAMELFDDFIAELKVKGAALYEGVEPLYAPEPVPVQEPPAKRQRRGTRLSAEEPALQPVKQELLGSVKMEKQEEDDDDTNALDALIAAASGVGDDEGAEGGGLAKKEQADDDTEDEDDPLMGAALKAAAARSKVKEEGD